MSKADNARREYTHELFREAEPIGLNLIVQTFHCAQCHKAYRTPADEPMVHLKSPRGNHILRHVRLSKYPYSIPQTLPRRIIEVEHTIEYCEECFAASDDRQIELFRGSTAEILPLPFNGKPVLMNDKPERPAPRAAKPKITLEYF